MTLIILMVLLLVMLLLLLLLRARSPATGRLWLALTSRHIQTLVMTLASVQDAHEFYLYTLSGLTRSALSGLVDDDETPAAASGAPQQQQQQADSQQQPASTLSLSGERSRTPRISRKQDMKPVSTCAYGAVVAGTQWRYATFDDLIS